MVAAFALYRLYLQNQSQPLPLATKSTPEDKEGSNATTVPKHSESKEGGHRTSTVNGDKRPSSRDLDRQGDKVPLGIQVKVGVHEPTSIMPSPQKFDPQAAAPPPPTVSAPPTIAAPPARSSSPPRLKPPTFGSMAPPPRPGNGYLRTPPSAAASLRVPAQKVLSNASMIPSSSLGVPQQKKSRQVTLTPGHSPLDWAALTKDPNSKMRGKDASDRFIRVTPAQLKYQNGRKGRDAWTVYQGKVYNITPYLPFHPGGEGELLRGAGKDSMKLFMEVHPWVNWEGMLSECMVGILVSDEDEGAQGSGGLDEMD